MNRIFHVILFVCLCCACAPSNYEVIGRQPTLSVNAPTVAEQGHPFTIELFVAQTGVSETFSLSAVVLSGQAVIILDGTVIDTNGQWVAFGHNAGKLIVTPTTSGELKLNLQAKSSEGELSERQLLTITITPATEITASTEHADQLINPNADTRVPIRLGIEKAGYDGSFTVSASVVKGAGKIYKDNYAINDTQILCGASTTLEFSPKTLGEHIVEFTITVGTTTTSAFAYVDIIKDITVSSNVTDCFTITGIGRHNTEGEEVTLALANNTGYNFEITGWYDGVKLLSENPTYTLKLSKACLSNLTIKLAKRTVNLSRYGSTQVKNVYLVMQNGKPVPKYVYDYRTGVSADHMVSEPIKFYYEAYQYNMSTIPPTASRYMAGPAFTKGTDWAGFFFRIDNVFNIYLRKEDNPGLDFNYYTRYVESANTRYNIPSSIIMQ